MAAIADANVSINAAGAIRWTGAATTNRHTVLEFIQWLMLKQAQEQAAGDDLLDITVDTPFDRSTDQIVTLNSPFNIDETFARHLYDGSVAQTNPTYGGEDLWSGLGIIGPSESGTEYMILQNGKVIDAFWGVGINPEAAPSLVYSRHLIKSKEAGSKIDGQRITVLSRELGDQYRRFPVTLGTGNSVAAIGNAADIFNETPDATIAGWSTIVNTEGFQELNIDGNGAAGQEFYSQWDTGSQSINDTYERTKWITQRAHEADATSGAVSGTNYVIENATILGQAQSFIPLSDVTEKLVEARWQIKIGGGTPTGTIYCELWDSDDASPGVPTGGALARSEGIPASAITSSYEAVIFRFNNLDPTVGSDQRSGLDLANTEYYIVLRHDAGDGSNFFHVEGSATSVDSTQDRAEDTGSWAGSGTTDLNLIVKSCPAIHGLPGEQFEGISVDVGFDNESGATGVPEDTIAMWGTKVFYDTLVGGPFFPGEPVTFRAEAAGNALKSGGIVLYDDATDELIVALDTPGAAVIDDNDLIEGLVSGATAAINVSGGAILDEDKGGGTGIVLAKDDNGTTGELYIQVMTGVTPVENNRIRASDLDGDPLLDFVDATAVIASRTLNPEFVGTSTGSNIIGAYGIGFDPNDVGSSDRFRSLDNGSRVPKNNVQFTISGLVIGEDRVLVGPRTGAALDRGQWLVSTALTAAAETALVVKTGTDTVPFPDAEENWPTSGNGAEVSRLRVYRDDGASKRLPYTSHDGTGTFTLTTGNLGGTLNVEVSGVGGAGGQFDRITAGSFLDDGYENGQRISTLLFTNGGNNATFTIDSVTDTAIVVVDDTGMVNESAGGGNETITVDGYDFQTGGTEGTGPSGWASEDASVNNDAFLAFIDALANATSLSFTGVHGGTNRDLYVRVRDGGGTPIKTFFSDSAQFLATPQTVAAVRTDDF
jgi:hypothetical protein